MNVDEAMLHFGADPIAGITVHLDVTASHVRSKMHTNSAVDSNPSLAHGSPNPTNLIEIAVDDNAVAAFAVDIEKITQRHTSFAVIDNERTYLGVGSHQEVIR